MTTAICKGYLLGVGSNLEPQQNIANIISLLLEHFPKISLSRILEIPPVGMNSQHYFLNVVLFLETPLAEPQLKHICNSIETQLGRDRDDPASKTKDRPADLDILMKVSDLSELAQPICMITDEYFIYPLLEEITAYLLEKPFQTRQAGTEVTIAGLSFGQTATTIYRDATTRDKRII